MVRHVFPEPFVFSFYFNMADPVIGGMEKEKIALRRAMAFALDVDALIRVVYAGQGLPATQFVPPGVGGHDPTLPAKALYDPAAANALLDRFGYKVRDPEGYRKTPDGKPLTVTMTLRSGAVMREVQTLWKKNMEAVGLRTDFHVTPFQDAIKELEQGKFQTYFGGFGGSPSGYNELSQLHSRQPQRVNVTQFKDGEFDRAADAFVRSADERGAGRRREEDDRDRVHLHAGAAGAVPAREQHRAAVGAGLRAADLHELLEVPRHRSWQARKRARERQRQVAARAASERETPLAADRSTRGSNAAVRRPRARRKLMI